MNSLSASTGLPASIQSQLATAQLADLKNAATGRPDASSAQATSSAHATSSSQGRSPAHAGSTQAAEVGQDFESVFVSMMLKQMRGSMTEDGLFGGDSSDTYGGIFDMYLGKHLADGNPLGIGDMVESYVNSESKS